jgi:hypothetical protein
VTNSAASAPTPKDARVADRDAGSPIADELSPLQIAQGAEHNFEHDAQVVVPANKHPSEHRRD